MLYDFVIIYFFLIHYKAKQISFILCFFLCYSFYLVFFVIKIFNTIRLY